MFTLRSIRTSLLLSMMALLAIAGCSDSSTGTDGKDINFDASAMLKNEANNVILQTYIDLDTEAGKLVTAVEKLKSNTTQTNLKDAQQQWKNTREPWESSESFLLGPVASEGIDPAIDSWPLDKTDLEGVLNSSEQLDKKYIDNLNNNLKGFHTIEFLLFGDASNKTVFDFTSREFNYLVAAAKSLKSETAQLATAWKPSGENYTATLADAGSDDSKYTSKKSAIEELVNAMEIIADEVANGKIADPFSQKNPTLVESQFSFNSKTDFQNNIRSIRHIYTGNYKNNNGPGVSNYVVKLDKQLDARFKDEIDAAISAIDNISGNFRDAITQNRDDVAKAQDAVRTILSTIQEDIKPLSNEL